MRVFHGGPYDDETLLLLDPHPRIRLASPMAAVMAEGIEPFSPVELRDVVYERRNGPSGAAYHYDFVERVADDDAGITV